MNNLDEALFKLGIDKLKPKQKTVLKYLLQNRDVFALLPTGYGKSLCYIVPHLTTGKNVIVISPLIALMKDQQTNLQERGISSVCFNSHNTSLHSDLFGQGDIEKLKSGTLTGILYFSPERFLKSQSLILDLVERDLLALVAVDEAHCVTGWSDFRKSYTHLDCIRKWIPHKTPILALSASVAPNKLQDIAEKLRLKRARVVKAPFWKNNLAIEFRSKMNLDQDLSQMMVYIKNNTDRTIIYCKTQAETKKVSQGLNLKGVKSSYYHGGLESEVRNSVQEQFQSGDTRVLVSTIAFGMGIDIPDIHLVIHYGISRDIESYYQEVGRAGRDGGLSKCVTFYSPGDLNLNRRFASQINDPIQRQCQLDSGVKLEVLIHTPSCRMMQLANYFGDESSKICNICDVCCSSESVTGSEPELPLPDIVYRLLGTLIDLGYGCGSRTLASIMTGGKNKRINERMQRLSFYGYYRAYSQTQVVEWVKLILYSKLLREHSSGMRGITYLKISDKGHDWYKNNCTRVVGAEAVLVRLFRYCVPPKKPEDILEKANNKTISTSDFLEKLRVWRGQRAKQSSIPTYCILSNKTMGEIAIKNPRSRGELLAIKGIGQKKLDQFASEILAILS